MAESILQQCESHIPENWKNKCTGEPNLEAVYVEAIDFHSHSQGDVIDNCESGRCCYTVVTEHVRAPNPSALNMAYMQQDEKCLHGNLWTNAVSKTM
jgi:hypothetical protein